MGKATGFLEFTRELPEKRPVEERVKDYNEFIERYSDQKLNQQAARCMDCGVPFCHSGCPLGNIIPEFNDAVYRKSWAEAYDILMSTNNFPEFTGRICPAPCESACVLGINQPAITIEEIEKHIIEIAFDKGMVKPIIPHVRTGKKIAVIGSGPAGLACADAPRRRGYTRAPSIAASHGQGLAASTGRPERTRMLARPRRRPRGPRRCSAPGTGRARGEPAGRRCDARRSQRPRRVRQSRRGQRRRTGRSIHRGQLRAPRGPGR